MAWHYKPFLLTSKRLRYRMNSTVLIGPQKNIFPCIHAAGCEIDTHDVGYFDGGSFQVDVRTGIKKGDSLMFLTEEQQAMAAARPGGNGTGLLASRGGWQGYLEMGEDKKVRVFPHNPDDAADSGWILAEIKRVDKATLRAEFATHDPPRCTVALFTYLLDTVAFSTELSAGTGQRVIAVKIDDLVSAEKCTAKIVVDVARPLFCGIPEVQTVAAAALVSEGFCLAEKITLASEGKERPSTSGGLDVIAHSAVVQYRLSLKRSKLVKVEGSTISVNGDLAGVVAKEDPHHLRIEFPTGTKSTVKTIASLLQLVTIKFAGETYVSFSNGRGFFSFIFQKGVKILYCFR